MSSASPTQSGGQFACDKRQSTGPRQRTCCGKVLIGEYREPAHPSNISSQLEGLVRLGCSDEWRHCVQGCDRQRRSVSTKIRVALFARWHDGLRHLLECWRYDFPGELVNWESNTKVRHVHRNDARPNGATIMTWYPRGQLRPNGAPKRNQL